MTKNICNHMKRLRSKIFSSSPRMGLQRNKTQMLCLEHSKEISQPSLTHVLLFTSQGIQRDNRLLKRWSENRKSSSLKIALNKHQLMIPSWLMLKMSLNILEKKSASLNKKLIKLSKIYSWQIISKSVTLPHKLNLLIQKSSISKILSQISKSHRLFKLILPHQPQELITKWLR